MGTTYCNGKFWSPPRGDTPNYNDIVCYDGTTITTYPVEFEHPEITRKYSDFIAYGNKLYAMPFGERGNLTEVLVFDTDTLEHHLQQLDIADFYKKYNCGVLVDDCIIAVPYGTKEQDSSSKGLVYNCVTGEHYNFDLGDLGFGGKYRFRSGMLFNNLAVFFPTGTPAVPMLAITKTGKIVFQKTFKDFVMGRPVLHENKLWTVCYHLINKTQHLVSLDQEFNLEFVDI